MSAPPSRLDQPIQDGPKVNSPARKIFRALAATVIVLAGILVITVASHPAAKDYISYWSAGKLLVHHADPYSPAGVLALERTQGYLETRPLIMRNPPWALFLAAPLGFGNPLSGLLLWTIIGTGCILASIQLLDIPAKDRVLAFLFAPALAAICAGQSSPFLLLGFSLFLRFHQSRPFLAGASLLLMAIKPHLFLIFWALLLVDCLYRRRFLIFVGGASALAAATAFAMYVDPRVWTQYFTMLRASRLDHEFVPTVSTLFRLLIDVKADWLQLIPSCLALLWGCWYYARRRQVWDWRVHGMLLMLVTVLVSPYSWFPDEIVLLPSLAFALYLAGKRRYSAPILISMNGLLILMLLVAHIPLTTGVYFWTPVAWLAWFLYATHRSSLHSPNFAGPVDWKHEEGTLI